MADYHPLIARAVDGLDKNTGENRRALYERARTALVAQLRGVTPALDESEITRERLALEEAIRKVEAESARRAREEPRPPRPAEPPRREAAPPPAPVEHAPPPPVYEPPAPPPPAPLPPRGTQTSLSEEALKGFRDVAGEPAPGEPHHTEWSPPVLRHAPPPPPPPEPHAPENLWDSPLHHAPPEPLPPVPDEPAAFADEPPANGRPRPPRQPPRDTEPPRASRPKRRTKRPRPARAMRSYLPLLRIALPILLVVLLAAAALWQREAIGNFGSSIVAAMKGSSTQTAKSGDTAPATKPKIADRIGQPGQQATPVAQRVVLYEEDPDDPQGKRSIGTAIWRTEMMPGGPGKPAELAVRADVSVPDRQMTMTWTLRRNNDASLPASHTIEIMFTLPADAPSGGVQNVPGVLMKQAEATRGVPLAGLAVKVTPGFFLIGLSSIEADKQRNLQLLKERSWFDIPIVYNNNRRAILAMEKGTPGEQVFNEAFAAWKE